jgi:hypothetical protein
MADNPFAKFAPAAALQAANPFGAYTVGTPNPRIAAQEDRAERADLRAERESVRAEQRFRAQQQREDLRDSRTAGATALAQVAASRLPGDKEKELREAVSSVSSLGRAQNGFRDDYVGFGSGIENLAQEYTGFGTPGQRDWWADFRSTDNLSRNALFGASLTAGEKSAYAATTISPNMDPAQVRTNIARRAEIARAGLGRYRDYLLKSGYGQEAIDSLIGDALSAPATQTPPRSEAQNKSDVRPRIQSFSVDNLADFATGLSGGKYAIERDGLYYTAPGGRSKMVDLSDNVANSDEYHAAYKAKFGSEPPLQVSVTGGASSPGASSGPPGRGGGGITETADAFVRGAADTVALGSADEIAAAGRTIFGEGTMRDNLRQERAVDAYDRDHHGVARFAGQFAGGFALPIGRTGTGMPPSAAQLAKYGAGYSGVYGFGSGEGSAIDRLMSAGTNAVAGGLVGYGLGRGTEALLNIGRRSAAGRGVNMDTVRAADRQGIELVRPDVDPTRRNTYGFLESLPIAGGRVRSDLQRGTDQFEQRVADVGGGLAVPRATAGDTVRAAGERFIDRSRTVTNRLYDRAAALAGDARVSPDRLVAALDTHIAELASTPNANSTKLNLLNQLRDDLVDNVPGQPATPFLARVLNQIQGRPPGSATATPGTERLRSLSIQSLRDLRTAMRDELGSRGLRYTDAERRIMGAIDSASGDIAGQLHGPALRAYQRADQAYRRRVELVDNVVEWFIGNDRNARRSGEAIMAQVENAAQPRSGDAATLAQMMERLEPRERQQVASTIAAQLGRRGQDGDNAFSPNLFFSQVAKYSPESRAAIFGLQGARDLADLARIAKGRAGTLGRLNNSRSGQVGNWFRAIQSVLSGGGAGAGVGAAMGGVAGAGSGAAAGVVTTPFMLGGAYLSARALGNRRVVQTLLQAANATTPSARAVVLRRMGALASREPALRTELLPIQRLLSSSIEGMRPALAADEGDRRRQQR